MDPVTQRALLNVMVHAALADGQKSDAERAAIRDATESLAGQAGGAALAGVYQDVLLRRVTLAQAVAQLQSLEHRQLAYEMAVCVCDSDGVQSAAEQQFLASLRQALALDAGDPALGEAAQADSIAAAAASAPEPQAAPPTPAPAAATRDAELDKRILNTAILCGALELLPQAWASMAIIPLQVRLVYVIGQAHGTQLDQGHIKEFIATVGVGLTSQYVEQIGRKLIGGLVGKAAGRLLGGVSSAGVGMATSFATTYALGQVARRYYSEGRVMSTELLKRTFQDMTGQAKTLQQQYLPAIRERASTLSATEVVELVRR